MGVYKEVDRKRRKGIDGMKVVGGQELIDTFWNVNDDAFLAFYHGFRN